MPPPIRQLATTDWNGFIFGMKPQHHELCVNFMDAAHHLPGRGYASVSHIQVPFFHEI